jgi:hypothetical protein
VILGAIFINTFGGGLTAIWIAFLFTAPVTAYLVWRKFRNNIDSDIKALV